MTTDPAADAVQPDIACGKYKNTDVVQDLSSYQGQLGL
jgi:hypothetical protein